jgi:hypothetical protein
MEAGYCRGPGPSRAVAPQMMMMISILSKLNKSQFSVILCNLRYYEIHPLISLIFSVMDRHTKSSHKFQNIGLNNISSSELNIFRHTEYLTKYQGIKCG